ncbi:MAG: hypothetical protein KFH87_13480 [Bacteroidetes bacterium]|nr:hypothetical protein [Bacteroidota bacterium]
MKTRLLFIALLLLLSSGLLTAQQEQDVDTQPVYYDTVVRLKDGTVIRDVEVSYEHEVGRYERYVIKSRDGTIVRVLPSDVLVIETHARTFYPPVYNPIGIIYPCDDRQREAQWYFLELRGWVYMTGADESENAIGIDRIAFGPEIVPGLRFGNLGAGVGVSLFRAREIDRIPVFLHLRHQLSARCFAPFLYAQAGTVFDNQSGYRPTVGWLLERSAKLLGIGAGIDYPLASWMDLSVDIGYRYLQLPTRVLCDCSDQPEVTEALYYNESHGVLLRAGVTF